MADPAGSTPATLFDVCRRNTGALRAGPPASIRPRGRGRGVCSTSLGALRIQVLQQLVRSQLDLLVAPLGRAVMTGDQAHAMHAAKVAVHERVAPLRLVVGVLGERQMPERVLAEGVRLQERVLLPSPRLDVLPARTEH